MFSPGAGWLTWQCLPNSLLINTAPPHPAVVEDGYDIVGYWWVCEVPPRRRTKTYRLLLADIHVEAFELGSPAAADHEGKMSAGPRLMSNDGEIIRES
jgi:hypothetical protein